MNIWQELKKPFLILAPMEGVTDVIFRQVVAKAGRPDLFYTEFTNVSSYASEKGRANALERLQVVSTDKPIIAQIWGKEPDHFAETVRALKDLGFSGVDINFGCPDKNVNRAGGGAAMIKTPELAIECLKAAKANTELPVSVKTRLGWSKIEEFKEWLPTLLNEHPAALTVHLRTKKEMSKVDAHYELIPEVIKLRDEISSETKLIINGDIKNREQAMELHEKYPEVDGFMIGRGVFQNPYCFTNHEPTREELIELLKYHLVLYQEYADGLSQNRFARARLPSAIRVPRGERYGARSLEAPRWSQRSSEDHPHIPYEPLKHFFKIYINNFPGASDIRAKLMETHAVEEVWSIIDKI